MLTHYQVIKNKNNGYFQYAVHTVYSDNENNIIDIDTVPVELAGRTLKELKTMLTSILADVEVYGIKTMEELVPEYLEEDTDYEDEYLDEEDKVVDLVDLFNKNR